MGTQSILLGIKMLSTTRFSRDLSATNLYRETVLQPTQISQISQSIIKTSHSQS